MNIPAKVRCDRCGERKARYRITYRTSGVTRRALRCAGCSTSVREAIDRAGERAVWRYERLPRLSIVRPVR